MRIRRPDGHLPYILTVAPLGADLSVYGRPLAMIVLAYPDQQSPSERDLAEFLSVITGREPARGCAVDGKKLREIALDWGAQITTLRTQLSSILRKTGVERQVDLIRLLACVPVTSTGTPETK